MQLTLKNQGTYCEFSEPVIHKGLPDINRQEEDHQQIIASLKTLDF